MDQPTPVLKKLSERTFAIVVALVAAGLFYFSTNGGQKAFDYTHRIAMAMLEGHVGLAQKPPSWLNEMVPFEGRYYSVFPLGAVLVNLPTALLQKLGVFREWPANGLAAVVAGGCVYFFYLLSHAAEMSRPRRVLLSLFPIFATWTWCNLGYAGAWQMALGFALLGETAALYYTLLRPNPLLAGAWIAVACGNRTELFITLPIFAWLWFSRPLDNSENEEAPTGIKAIWRRLRSSRPHWLAIAKLAAFPAMLLLFTAAYNLARFGSVFDFGYARIPGVLQEPWYKQGLFSLSAIRWNAYEMLFRGLIDLPKFPYLRPHAFGTSIFLASPFLFLLFREGGKHRAVCWGTIGLLTFILWCHGNPGGWQFSYRYGIVLLPWMFLLIAENGPRRLSIMETTLFVISVLLCGLATYEFLWTTMIKP
jgi:hypothetical protein